MQRNGLKREKLQGGAGGAGGGGGARQLFCKKFLTWPLPFVVVFLLFGFELPLRGCGETHTKTI
jgi:hypothetical protein